MGAERVEQVEQLHDPLEGIGRKPTLRSHSIKVAPRKPPCGSSQRRWSTMSGTTRFQRVSKVPDFRRRSQWSGCFGLASRSRSTCLFSTIHCCLAGTNGSSTTLRVGRRDLSSCHGRCHFAFICSEGKDRDFVDLLERHGPPPRVVWPTCGNTSHSRLLAILRDAWPRAAGLMVAGEPLVEIGDHA